ncbi:MAG: hypothetical protein ACO3DT_14905 [Gammaproteobacteria bacterium]
MQSGSKPKTDETDNYDQIHRRAGEHEVVESAQIRERITPEFK